MTTPRIPLEPRPVREPERVDLPTESDFPNDDDALVDRDRSARFLSCSRAEIKRLQERGLLTGIKFRRSKGAKTRYRMGQLRKLARDGVA